MPSKKLIRFLVPSLNIVQDLHRTSPEHEYFQTPEGLQALQNVLTAYSWHNSIIGYCQSMNMIASMLLLLLPEEHAFFVLCAICELLVPEYYSKQMIGAIVDQRLFEGTQDLCTCIYRRTCE